MATLRIQWGRLLPVIAVLLALAAPVRADVSESPLDLRDLEVTVYVRRALMQEPDIARLNLSVSVHYNQATISGRVPSREVAEQVMRIVENVKGVYQVKDALRIIDDDAEKAVRDLTAGLEADLFNVDLFNSLEVPPPGKPQEVTTAQPDPRAWEQPAAPVVVLLPPVPETAPSVRTPAITLSMPREEERVDLAAMIEQLRFAEQRYHEVRVEVSAGRVTLSGRVASAEHLIELGRTLSQLPGVRHVDLRGVLVGR